MNWQPLRPIKNDVTRKRASVDMIRPGAVWSDQRGRMCLCVAVYRKGWNSRVFIDPMDPDTVLFIEGAKMVEEDVGELIQTLRRAEVPW